MPGKIASSVSASQYAGRIRNARPRQRDASRRRAARDDPRAVEQEAGDREEHGRRHARRARASTSPNDVGRSSAPVTQATWNGPRAEHRDPAQRVEQREPRVARAAERRRATARSAGRPSPSLRPPGSRSRGPAARRRTTRPSRGSSATWLPAARGPRPSTRRRGRAQRVGDASTPGSAASRFGEIAASASAVLFSNVFVTVSIPADAISIGTRLGCGVYMSASPTSCARSTPAYSPCAERGSSSRNAPPPRSTRRAAARCRCRAAPSRRQRAALDRAAEREHAELEHVARRVRLGPRIEQQPARASAGERGGVGVDRRDRVLERRRRLAASPAAVHAEPVAAEVVAQQLGGEQRVVREAVRLVGQRGVAAHRERERLVLLDQVQEPLAAERAAPRGRCAPSTTWSPRTRRRG